MHHIIYFLTNKMLWPLFLAPWAATCYSKKVGLQVSLAFMALHYGYRKPFLQALMELLNKRIGLSVKDGETQTHSEATGEFAQGPRETEENASAASEATEVEIGGYNCYMIASKRKSDSAAATTHSPFPRRNSTVGGGGAPP